MQQLLLMKASYLSIQTIQFTYRIKKLMKFRFGTMVIIVNHQERFQIVYQIYRQYL